MGFDFYQNNFLFYWDFHKIYPNVGIMAEKNEIFTLTYQTPP